jgi:dihydrofolate reductase
MKITLVAAVARDGGIGRGNELLWREKADQQHFRAVTAGLPVVMGRRTWESLPPRFRPLPGRRNVVVSGNPAYAATGAERAANLEDALTQLQGEPQVCVIGGSALYASALPHASVLELTEVDAVFDADTFFPAWDRSQFREASRVPGQGADGTRFAFVRYERV